MFLRRCIPAVAAVAALSVAAGEARAQAGTGYYGGLDYQRYYGYGRDYWPFWYGEFRPYVPRYSPALPPAPVAGGHDGVAFYGPAAEPLVARSAALDVRLPAEAELWIEGQKMVQTGADRKFVSPPLPPGQRFTYELRARWKEAGRDVTKTKHIDVSAGDRLLVDFLTRGPGRIDEFPAKK